MDIHLSLPDALARYVREMVESGEFASPEDVVTASLGAMLLREREERESFALFRDELAVAAAQLDRGEGIAGDEVLHSVLDEIGRLREAA